MSFQALGRVRGRGHRADPARRARFSHCWQGRGCATERGFVGIALEVAIDAQPVHLARLEHALGADHRDVVLGLAGDHARATAGAGVEVDGEAPLVVHVGLLRVPQVEELGALGPGRGGRARLLDVLGEGCRRARAGRPSSWKCSWVCGTLASPAQAHDLGRRRRSPSRRWRGAGRRRCRRPCRPCRDGCGPGRSGPRWSPRPGRGR